MSEWISREEIRNLILEEANEIVGGYDNPDSNIMVNALLDLVDSCSTINPDDLVKHGEWGTSSDRPDRLICSVCNCGFDMWKHDRHNYCPSCGAKMDLGSEK